MVFRPVLAEDAVTNAKTTGLANAVVLIIRHAEKPDAGKELSAEGCQRADAYPGYFAKYTVGGNTLHLNHLFAAADSKGSERSRRTIEPLAKSLGMTVDTRFSNKQVGEFAAELKATPHGTNILVAWHHGKIPDMINELGGDSAKLFTGADSKWPDDVFDWVIQLRYDATGKLLEEKLIHENLMPADLAKQSPK